MRNLQPVSIDGVEFDALLSSQEEYNAEVPVYPVDSGFSVSDNVALDAMELTMTLYLTATPVTWVSRHGIGEERIKTICDQLLNKYTAREPLTVVTRDKTFTNMVIKTISIEKSEDALIARTIPITLTQVTVTSSAEAEVPAKLAKSGTTKTNSGTAGTTSASGSDGSSGDSTSSGSVVGDIIQSAVNVVTGNGSTDNRTDLKRLTDTAGDVAKNIGSAIGSLF